MERVWILVVLSFMLAYSKEDGRVIFENACLRCHTENSSKPLRYLMEKYKGKAEEVKALARRCPWGKGLSDMEIDLVSRWLAGQR
ncbi:hypothetical protein Thal_0837 [Thermocrinis albus DSM 14484]|uniref:Cytochrome c domain-containing protein n=1 Tax=Thermocrinis albus (strain DSM 14484 / JCM 11386 / HI 11/12) TaxID=638303 RepID=D3SL40_THEAH|nr:cytochrome c [Thermocrinis albus]ADC89470.1 hypothetical protein Thal_0837 [Thermocrinis albus DSM 14484]